MTDARATPLIDRTAQNLAVPLGGMAPMRVQPRRPRQPRLEISKVLILIGLLCGAIGVGLLFSPAPVTVALVGDRLEVGGMTLTALAPADASQRMRYQGDASYVLAEHGDGSATAAAAWVSGGVSSTGVCKLHNGGGFRLIEECVFRLGSVELTSVDVLDPGAGSAWQRTYADGTRATIAVSANGGVVPVPFPIGR